MNKPFSPRNPRRLDAQAIDVLSQVADEFVLFASVAKEKADTERDGSTVVDAITTMLADVLARPETGVAKSTEKPQQTADAFAAHVVWLSEAPLLPGRGYVLNTAGQTAGAMITELKYRVDVATLEHLAAKDLHRNEIGF